MPTPTMSIQQRARLDAALRVEGGLAPLLLERVGDRDERRLMMLAIKNGLKTTATMQLVADLLDVDPRVFLTTEQDRVLPLAQERHPRTEVAITECRVWVREHYKGHANHDRFLGRLNFALNDITAYALRVEAESHDIESALNNLGLLDD